MTNIVRCLLAVAGLATASLVLSCDSQTEVGASVTAIERVTIVDVERGSLLADQTILISGSRIQRIGPRDQVDIPAGAQRVDGTGKFVIPGMWDMHVHYPQNDTLRRMYLQYGVTGVREMGNVTERVLANRRSISAGTWLGPRYVTSVMYVDGAAGYAEAEATLNPTTAAEAVAAVDSLVSLRADFVKVLGEIPRDVYLALVSAARDRGLRVAGHWQASLTIDELIGTAPASIEHGLRVSTTCLYESAERCASRMSELDADRLSVTGQKLASAGIWFTPTLVNQRRRAFGGDSSFKNDPRIAAIPQRIVDRWAADTIYSRRPRPIVRLSYDKEAAGMSILAKAGVRFLAGTDGPGEYLYAGSSLHDELVLLVEAGLSSAQALRSATSGPAEFLRMSDSLGTVATGKVADLVLLDGDPLADIGNVRRIQGVMLGGRWITDVRARAGPAVANRDGLR